MIELVFAEDEPVGPVQNGDHDEYQIHESWSRRFIAEFGDRQTYFAVLDLTFYQVRQRGTVTLFREEEYAICTTRVSPHDEEKWADVAHFEQAPGDENCPLLARDACEEPMAETVRWPERYADKLEIYASS